MRRTEQEWNEFMDAQTEALASGSEIEPPWIVFPSSAVYHWNFKQGNNQAWKMGIWNPFWHRLSREEKIAYLEKWNAPAVWREKLAYDIRVQKEEKNETDKPEL